MGMPKPNSIPLSIVGPAGQMRFQNLLRIAHETHRSVTSVPGEPTTVDILRVTQIVAGNPAAGIQPTFVPVAGLNGIAASYELPDVWNRRLESGGVPLKANERVVWLRDVPATATERQDVVLLTDRVRFDDPIYGPGIVWSVFEIRTEDAARLIRVLIRYARQEA